MVYKESRRLPVVDGLRAYAVLAVVLFHFFPVVVPGGFIGVDIFFVISGFVISHRYQESLISGETSFAKFFQSRIRRLVPAYLLMMLVVTIAAITIMPPKDLINFGTSLVGQAAYVQNIVFWNQGDYFDRPLLKPLLHTWSLAIEEQFYLFFPLFIILLRWRRSFAWTLIVTGALFTIMVGWHLGQISPKTTFYLLPFRVWEFVAGILAAAIYSKGWDRYAPSKLANTITGGAVLGIIAASLFYDEAARFPGMQAFVVVIASVLICLLQSRISTAISPLFCCTPIQHIGRISYSWYLWHWPPISLYFIFTGIMLEGTSALVVLLLSYLVAVLSYNYVEQWGMTANKLRTPAATYALMASFLLPAAMAGFVLYATNGLVYRYQPQLRTLHLALMDRPSYRCSVIERLTYASAEICKINDVKSGQGLLIIGDSHADAVKGVIAQLGINANIPVYFTKLSCKIIDYGIQKRCPISTWNSLVKDIKNYDIKNVVAISHWPSNIDALLLDAAIKRLQILDVTTYLELPKPYGPLLNPANYINNADSWGDESDYLRSEYLDFRTDDLNLIQKSAQNVMQIHLLDPLPLLCPDEHCLFAKDGKPLYSDEHHLTSAGQRILVPMYSDLFTHIE